MAKKDIRKVENLIRQGLAETPEGEIKYFRKLLCLPLLILYRELEERKQANLASLIRERYKKLFPASGIKGN